MQRREKVGSKYPFSDSIIVEDRLNKYGRYDPVNLIKERRIKLEYRKEPQVAKCIEREIYLEL